MLYIIFQIILNSMKATCFLFIFHFIALVCSNIDYQNQSTWTGDCNVGKSQSPIDIPCSQYINVCPTNKKYKVYWQNPYMRFGASSYQDLKTAANKNSWVRYSNETDDYIFKLAQFHLHQPSEHTVNGQKYPLQIHFVHILDNPKIKEFLVIGIFFQVDKTLENDIFDRVKINSHTSFSHLFPFSLTDKSAFHYRGSLTTPPCLQAVNWFVQMEPILIKEESMQDLVSQVGHGHYNNRKVQALQNRTVYLVGQEC